MADIRDPMADIRDYLAAERDTDRCLQRVMEEAVQASNRVDDHSFATLLSAQLLALSVRELGTRLDYVLRDLERREAIR